MLLWNAGKKKRKKQPILFINTKKININFLLYVYRRIEYIENIKDHMNILYALGFNKIYSQMLRCVIFFIVFLSIKKRFEKFAKNVIK